MIENSLLTEHMSDFIDERLNESYNHLVTNKEFKSLEKTYNTLFNNVSELIDNKALIEKYEKYRNYMYDMQTREAYKIGFYDAVSIFFKRYQDN